MKIHFTVKARGTGRLASFTLVELLTVMTIIAILAALTLAAANGVFNTGARARARGEVQAMSTALEGYKTDNGIYPPVAGLTTNTYSASDGSSSGGVYQQSSQLLYQALSGQTNYADVPVSTSKSYMTFKINQLGNSTAPAGTTGNGSTYIKDPWSYAYGYSTGTVPGAATTNYPYNGNGFFDLWSTGGVTLAKYSANNSLTNAWIANWF
jgi:prepilin-type N-terminal cleavage/methylation domain-containing protein